jgi:hypothetical protein
MSPFLSILPHKEIFLMELNKTLFEDENETFNVIKYVNRNE